MAVFKIGPVEDSGVMICSGDSCPARWKLGPCVSPVSSKGDPCLPYYRLRSSMLDKVEEWVAERDMRGMAYQLDGLREILERSILERRGPEDDDAADAAEIEKCAPCKKCGVKPVWGSGFLLCPKCGWETGYNDPEGAAVRQWNKKMKPRENGEN